MSTLGFLIKPQKKMGKRNTCRVKVGKYTLTSHAQNRIVDKTRKMDKIDVLDNLFTKPLGTTQIEYRNGRPAYQRVGKRITTVINPQNNWIATCRPVSRQDRREFDLVNIGKKGRKKKYVKRNSKKRFFRES